MSKKCCICGYPYETNDYFDCPVCGWTNTGFEEIMYGENDHDSMNGTTRAEAKAKYAKGLDMFGDPIKKQI